MGIGFGVNQTRLRQNAPTIHVDFSNPHKAGFGFSTHAVASLKFGNKFSAHLRPGLSILTTNSDVTSDQLFGFFTLSPEFGYAFTKRASINVGLRYDYLLRWLSKFNGPYRNWTFFANRRHFLSPVMSLGYQVDTTWRTHIRFGYFLQDVFNSGALDHDGNIVGPVMVYPYTIEIGCDYLIIKEARKSKKD